MGVRALGKNGNQGLREENIMGIKALGKRNNGKRRLRKVKLMGSRALGKRK